MNSSAAPIALAFLVALAGCGKKDDTANSSAPPPPAPATAPAPAPAPAEASTPAAAPPSSSGASAPSGGASGTTSSAGSATTTAAAGTSGSTGAAGSAGGGGQGIYAQTCAACHAAGVAGAPKLGDKADWGPRIAQGKDTLYTHAIGGFQGKKGVMPPKGGNTQLSDADVKSAVDHMVSQAGG